MCCSLWIPFGASVVVFRTIVIKKVSSLRRMNLASTSVHRDLIGTQNQDLCCDNPNFWFFEALLLFGNYKTISMGVMEH